MIKKDGNNRKMFSNGFRLKKYRRKYIENVLKEMPYFRLK